ncbi:MAG: hypothetical protein ACYDCK_14570 [Thermoplasmatota archaeon]
MARATSVLRSHLPHTAHETPPARLNGTISTAFSPAQIGQMNGISTGAFDVETVDTL